MFLRSSVGTILLAVIFSTHCASESTGDGRVDKLVKVFVIFRHGDRTPVEPYPNDPYKDQSNWPVDFGQLTNLGKLQHYELGRWLRRRYADFLPLEYNETQLRVRSTDVDRTLMSVSANLAGLYPPTTTQLWNPAIDWQPIPVHTRPEVDDAVLAMKKPCPRYGILQEQALRSPPFSDVNKENAALYSYLSENSGAQVNSIEKLEYLYNTLFIESLYNKTLPEWTKRVYPDKMRPTAELSFAVACYTSEMARLKAGPFFHDLLQIMSNVTAGQDRYKMRIYSGHDTTIANILNSLKVFKYHGPPYASTILIEVYQREEKGMFVRMFYKKDDKSELITLPDCQADCPIQDFRRILAPLNISPEEWQHACQASLMALLPFTTMQNAVIISCAVIFLLLAISMIIGLSLTRPKASGNRQQYVRLPDGEDVA